MMDNDNNENWKNQTYLMGGIVGGLFGLLAAYLFNRAAEEEAERNGGKPTKIPTMQLIGLSLAGLNFIRQITEAGKGGKQGKKR